MSALEVLEPIFKFIPEVKSPVHREEFNEKLKWTAIVLVLYFFLTQIPLYGVSAASIDQFAQLRAVMAGSFGSILTLGIGPIVTASIVLQLLVGSNLLDLDLSSHKDKSQFQATQKVLSIIFTLFIDFTWESIEANLPLIVGVVVSFVIQEILAARVNKD